MPDTRLISRLSRFALDLCKSYHPLALLRERLMEVIVCYSVAFRLYRSPHRFIAVGFDYTKRAVLRCVVQDKSVLFVPHWASKSIVRKLTSSAPAAKCLIWSQAEADWDMDELWQNRTLLRFEDGFLRSSKQGVIGALARSWVCDKRGLHFAGVGISDIECALSTTDFSNRKKDLVEAQGLLNRFRNNGASKYGAGWSDLSKLPKNAVLVLGQVEDDASIMANPDGLQTNEKLLTEVLANYPNEQVYYRAHPDVALGKRARRSNPEKLLPQSQILSASSPIAPLLASAEHVCTISSLGGFEALIHGAKVSTYGRPFYAGWGLTEDRLTFSCRKRKLELIEMFLIAYIDYPLYFTPEGEPATFSETLDTIIKNPS